MAKFKIRIDKDALYDIQEATDWYNAISAGLGTKFQKQVKQQINALKAHPQSHAIRYSDVRCCLINKFPYLVHYVVDEFAGVVEVFAVIHTSRNPAIWKEKQSRKRNIDE